MTRILGLSAYYHDSAACIVVDGKIVAAAQEERFSRIKHDPSFPAQAIEYCLHEAQCQLDELDAIIFYDKPLLKFERLLETYLATAPRGFLSFLRAMPVWLKEKLYLKSVLRRECRKLVHQQRARSNKSSVDHEIQQDKKPTLPNLLFSEHHRSHAASAFYPSPFDEALVLCLDGVGEWATSSAWLGKGSELKALWEIQFPHSLGLLYSAFTYYCGFKVNSGEYKLMGLAPYGEPVYVDLIYQHLIDVREDGSFALNMHYFDYPAGATMVNAHFAELFGGPPKSSHCPVSQKEMDLARSIQVVTENIVLNIARHAQHKTGCKNLCLAGGVALNCVANGRILRSGLFENIWVQPAAGDAGGALGAALIAWHQYFGATRANQQSELNQDAMQGAYLGPQFSNAAILDQLSKQQLAHQVIKAADIYRHTAELIEAGSVIGWFQGRMEFGPRALGNRSIIGDPRNQKMQSIMNLKIKQRESFRPFAPAVLAEDVSDYFDLICASPYMLLVADVSERLLVKSELEGFFGIDKLKQIRSTLPAITHVDNSARVQTVHQHTNPEFYALLKAFKELSACSVLINTSFNVRGEPPVCSPKDAIRCFLATDMDYLIMNNIVLDKKAMPFAAIAAAKAVSFAED
jgi:carbamoyltransferase